MKCLAQRPDPGPKHRHDPGLQVAASGKPEAAGAAKLTSAIAWHAALGLY
jgi:hypothetical protein